VAFGFLGSVQNERAAGIADTVQRGLGMLPQQADLRRLPIGEIEKMREPVQVYTACRFESYQHFYINTHTQKKDCVSDIECVFSFVYLQNLLKSWVQY